MPHGVPNDLIQEMNDMALEQRRQLNTSANMMVSVPGGKQLPMSAFLQHDFRPEKLTSIFADPEEFLLHPNAECKYVWKKKDTKLFQGIRSGAYKTVKTTDLKGDADLPMSSDNLVKDAGDTEFIAVMGLILVEVQPGAVAREYKYREQLAAQRTVRGLGADIMNKNLQSMNVSPELIRVEEVVKDKE